MTHKPGHATNPHYDELPWKTKMRYDKVMEGGDPTKKKKHKDRPADGSSRLQVNQ